MIIFHCFFAIGYRYEIIIAVTNLNVNLIVGLNVARSKPITSNIIFMCMVLSLSSIIFLTLFNILLIKIGEVNKQLKDSTT